MHPFQANVPLLYLPQAKTNKVYQKQVTQPVLILIVH